MASQQQSGGFRRLFEPLEIGDFTVRNRIVSRRMAPASVKHGTFAIYRNELGVGRVYSASTPAGECTGTP